MKENINWFKVESVLLYYFVPIYMYNNMMLVNVELLSLISKIIFETNLVYLHKLNKQVFSYINNNILK